MGRSKHLKPSSSLEKLSVSPEDRKKTPVLATLCYLRSQGKVLLIRKARGFGEGKLNAPGGQLRDGETPEECVVREVREETGLRVSNPRRHGVLYFYFGQTVEPDWVVYVFSSRKFDGQVVQGMEGTLHWVEEARLPYDEMWADDRHWVPLMLADKEFTGHFYFDKAASRLEAFHIA